MEKEVIEKLFLPLLEASRGLEGLDSANPNSSGGWKPDPGKALFSTMVLEGMHQHEVCCLTMWVTSNVGALATGPGFVLLTYFYLEGISKDICEYLLNLPPKIITIELLNYFFFFQGWCSKREAMMWGKSIPCIWHLHGVGNMLRSHNWITRIQAEISMIVFVEGIYMDEKDQSTF